MYKLRKTFFFACLLCFNLILSGQNTTIPEALNYHLDDDLTIQELPKISWIIEEGSERLTAEELQEGNLKDAKVYFADKDGKFELEFSKSLWYKIILRSDYDYNNEKLSINFPTTGGFIKTFNYVNAYFFVGGKLVNQGKSGLKVGVSQRDVKNIFDNSLIKFDIPKDKTLEIWVNIKGGDRFHSLISHSVISHRYELGNLIDNNYFLIGCLTSMFILGLFLFYWFGEKVYLWFLIFIGINFISQLAWTYPNEIIEILFPEKPILINKLIGLFDITKFIVVVLFARIFIKTDKRYPKLDKLMLVCVYLWVLVALVFIQTYLDNSLTTLIFTISFYIGLFGVLFAFGYFIFSKSKLARFYSIGAITPFLGIAVATWTPNNLIKVKEFAELFIGLGPVLALGLAMIYRFKVVVEEKMTAEAESKRILEQQNVTLEAQVKQRTLELSQSLENLKSTQSQLIQSEKMASLGELTAGIAHEIQNPLNFVNNFSELNQELADELEEELNKGDIAEAKAVAKYIKENEEKINHHGKRADAIVKGMLQHSRTSSAEKEPTDLNALADEYLRLSYHGLRAKDKAFNSDFKRNFDASLPKVHVIPQDIGRVLLNLINNAFYAVNEKAKMGIEGYKPLVTVSTAKVSDHVEVKVADNGNGIPDQVKAKIFQPFFTTKPTGQGTGLGLSMSYDIVTKGHGGELTVVTKEGKGSKFTIRLPLN
jgi:signal transduction histidine kinase